MTDTSVQLEIKRRDLRHAQLFLAKAKNWNAELNTDRAPEILKIMQKKIGDLEEAFNRVADPNQLDRPELARDLALALYNYYDKRSRWNDWINLGNLALKACQRLDDIDSQSALYNALGIAKRMLSHWNEAMSFYEQALALAKRDELKSDALTNIADIHRLLGETKQALERTKQAIELAGQIGDKDREAKGWEYKGLTYVGCKNYDEGIDCYERALLLRKETGNLPREAITQAYLVYALTHRGKNEDMHLALEYYKRAYKIETELDNRQSLARLDGDIAVAYNKLGKYKEAIDHSLKALYYNESETGIGFKRGIALNHARLAHSYLGLGDFEQALFHAHYVCKHREYLTVFDCSNLSGFSGVLLALAQHIQGLGNVERAKEYARIAIDFARTAEESDSLQAATQWQQQLR